MGLNKKEISLEYQEYIPSKPFRSLIKCFWVLKPESNEKYESPIRVIPDAYPEWIFQNGGQSSFKFMKGEEKPGSGAFCMGQFQGYVDIHFPPEMQETFSIKFHPEMAHRIWGLPMTRFSNTLVELDELGIPETKKLEGILISSESTAHKIRRTEEILKAFPRDPLPDLGNLMKMIFQDPVGIKIDQLAESMGVGKRRLEQVFAEKIGLPPKALIKLLRIRKAMKDIQSSSGKSLTEIAAEFDFFDQSHFNRQIKDSTGHNPAKAKSKEDSPIQMLHRDK